VGHNISVAPRIDANGHCHRAAAGGHQAGQAHRTWHRSS
jgi:hypothetical protein